MELVKKFNVQYEIVQALNKIALPVAKLKGQKNKGTKGTLDPKSLSGTARDRPDV